MFTLDTHEPTRTMMQTIELATAARLAGDEVVLYLHADGVYLTDPDRFLRFTKPFMGFESPRSMFDSAVTSGVHFWVAARALDHLGLELPEGMHKVSAQQVALALASFDQVITL